MDYLNSNHDRHPLLHHPLRREPARQPRQKLLEREAQNRNTYGEVTMLVFDIEENTKKTNCYALEFLPEALTARNLKNSKKILISSFSFLVKRILGSGTSLR